MCGTQEELDYLMIDNLMFDMIMTMTEGMVPKKN